MKIDLSKTKETAIGWVRKHPRHAAGVGVLFLGLVVMASRGGDESEEGTYYAAQRGDFLVSIVEGGTLQAVDEVVVRNELEGSSRVIFIIPEGTYVKEGDLIVELDAGEAEDALNQQQIVYEKSLSTKVAAENALVIMKSTVESEVRTAELNVFFANLDLEKFEQIEKRQEVRNAEIDIITAQESLQIAEEKLSWSEKLTKGGFETKSNLDADRLAVTNQTLGLEKAESLKTMLTEYDLTKLHETYKATHAEANAELERVKKQGESKIVQAESDLRAAEKTLELNDAKLMKMTEQFKATKLYAPQDGLAVYAISSSRFSNESLVEEGATVRQRQELIKIPDTSVMKVEVKVHESHIGQVEVGQPAFVVLDSLPDQRFRGEVTKVGLLPDTQSRWGNPNLKVYSTEIVVKDPLPDVKPGVSARAEIIITNLQDVVTVPIQAVTTAKGQQFCYLKKFGGPEPVPVEIGLFNTKYIEITSGLDEGDEILLAPPLETDLALDGRVVEDDEKLEGLPTGRPSGTRDEKSEAGEGGRRPGGEMGGEGGQRRDGGEKGGGKGGREDRGGERPKGRPPLAGRGAGEGSAAATGVPPVTSE